MENEIVDAHATPAPAPQSGSGELSENMLEHMDKQAELMQRRCELSIKRTKAQDWVDFQGKPYLQGHGAERIFATFGVRVEVLSREKVEKANNHYQYFVEVRGYLGELVADEEGDCASDDMFFKRRGTQPPATEINEGDVRKKAKQNALSRLAQAMFGISGLTWGQLKEFGLDSNKAGASVSFDKGSKGGKTQSQSTQKEETEKKSESREKARVKWNELVGIWGECQDQGMNEASFWPIVTERTNPSTKEVICNDTEDDAKGYIKFRLDKGEYPAILDRWIKAAISLRDDGEIPAS